MDERAANHPIRFLADLTSAMRATAEAARQSSLEQCRSDVTAYVNEVNAIATGEAQELRKAAEDDVVTIRELSRARVERVRIETEERIARRRDLLRQELEEYTEAVELQVQRVQERVDSFEIDTSQFFDQLLEGPAADPTSFAAMASLAPDPPLFAELDRAALMSELRAERRGSSTDAGTEAPDSRAETADAGGENGREGDLPAFWWLDAPATLAARARNEQA